MRAALIIALVLWAGVAHAGTLTWDANTEPDLGGYKVYSRVGSNAYGAPIATLGKVTTYTTIDAAPGIAQFFSITAYDVMGNESPKSAEVSKVIPLPGPTADSQLAAIKLEVCKLSTKSTLRDALRRALGGC